MRRYWLMKSEPSAYSIDDLQREKRAHWDGIRNYQARNLMRDTMSVGDLALFYHSNAKPTGVAGLCRICSGPYADPTQFLPDSPYYDPKSARDAPRWALVDVEFVEKFAEVVTLQTLKAHADALEGLMVIQRGARLSIQPVELTHLRFILDLASARTRVPD